KSHRPYLIAHASSCIPDHANSSSHVLPDAITKTHDARSSQIDRAPSGDHLAAGALGRLPREFSRWKRSHGALHAQSRGCRPCRGRDGAEAIALIAATEGASVVHRRLWIALWIVTALWCAAMLYVAHRGGLLL